jgi:hypothetical protein
MNAGMFVPPPNPSDICEEFDNTIVEAVAKQRWEKVRLLSLSSRFLKKSS